MNLVNNKAADADAAPELLECLKNLLFYHYHETEMPAKGTRDREVYDAAVAAIARATAVRRLLTPPLTPPNLTKKSLSVSTISV